MSNIQFELPQWAQDQGWEIDRIGVPKDGELVLHDDRCLVAHTLTGYCVIVRKKHVWPKELKPGWVTVDGSGRIEWWPLEFKPVLWENKQWISPKPIMMGDNIGRAFNIQTPHYSDWRDAIWEVKHE